MLLGHQVIRLQEWIAPCVLAGDSKQLPPAVMGISEVEFEHKLRNRLCYDGPSPPRAFRQASGLPVYRLRTQLDMADDLFDWVVSKLYLRSAFDQHQQSREPSSHLRQRTE